MNHRLLAITTLQSHLRGQLMSGGGAPHIVQTERLVLRRQLAADVSFLVDLWSDPDVTRHMGGPRDRAWLQDVFEETAADPFAERYDLWIVIVKETGRAIGHCRLLVAVGASEESRDARDIPCCLIEAGRVARAA